MEAVEKGNQLHQVLHMTAGDGENSYASNSLIQKEGMLHVKPILEESVVEVYTKYSPECITYADMGCSSGPNTFLPIWGIIQAIDETSKKLKNEKPLMLQVFLNDLPGNDFNSIFKSLPSFLNKLEGEMGGRFGHCFVAAMPGSFYGRLFPPNSLHLVHSSYSLHWCSEVPELPLNKGNVYMAKTSPPGVHRAYLDQFEKDFITFLRARSEEVITGGKMVLTLLGRDGGMDDKSPSEMWDFIGMTLNEMVEEGLIEESKLDSFNIPFYTASAEEVRNVIQSEGSFKINKLESFRVVVDASIDDGYNGSMDKYTKGKSVTNHIRAVSKSLLENHFGTDIVDVMYQRLSIKIEEHMDTTSGECISHVVSMTKV